MNTCTVPGFMTSLHLERLADSACPTHPSITLSQGHATSFLVRFYHGFTARLSLHSSGTVGVAVGTEICRCVRATGPTWPHSQPFKHDWLFWTSVDALCTDYQHNTWSSNQWNWVSGTQEVTPWDRQTGSSININKWHIYRMENRLVVT